MIFRTSSLRIANGFKSAVSCVSTCGVCVCVCVGFRKQRQYDIQAVVR